MKILHRSVCALLCVFMLSGIVNSQAATVKANSSDEAQSADVKTNEYNEPEWEMYSETGDPSAEAEAAPSLLSDNENTEGITYDGMSEDKYDVVVQIGDEYIMIGSYDTYEEAAKAYERRKMMRSVGTPAIAQNRSLISAQTAVVDISYQGVSTINLYRDENMTQKFTYIDGTGNSGVDALYLRTSSDGKAYQIVISGLVCWIPRQYVNLRADLDAAWYSSYYVKNGNMYHSISMDIDSYKYNAVRVGYNDLNLEEGKYYLSYDGHYFYHEKDMAWMAEDYRNGNHDHAINKGNPYYNYYQYLSHRSKSSYTAADIERYIETGMGIKKKITNYQASSSNSSVHAIAGESQLYDEGKNFVAAQNAYGANALMVLGLAKNESANGRSWYAYSRNNLFGHAAFDNSPDSASKYNSVNEGIVYHTKNYISERYASDPSDLYNYGAGSYFGDKQSGMNVNYASDPYWGEKAAQYYYIMDEYLGKKDYKKYAVGIHEAQSTIHIYQNASASSKVLYNSWGLGSYAVIILGEENGFYKIQADPTLSADRSSVVKNNGNYSFDTNYAYVKKSDIDRVLGTVPSGGSDNSNNGGSDSGNRYSKGDVNGDGYVSSKDYNTIKNHITGKAPLSGDILKRADVNGDGYISSKDYNAIKNHITGAKPLY